MTATRRKSEVCGAFFNQTLKVISDSSDDNDSDGAIVPQHSSGTVKVYKVELGDIEGNPCASTGMHDAASVIIEFEALKWLDRPEFVVVFHTSDFLQLLSISSASSTFRPSFEIGRHRVICRIDDMMLRPSIYGLALGILDRFRHSLWASMNISRVIVDPGRYDITRLPEVGLIDAQAEWQVCEYLNIVDREAKV